jgi:hypothetical protein
VLSTGSDSSEPMLSGHRLLQFCYFCQEKLNWTDEQALQIASKVVQDHLGSREIGFAEETIKNLAGVDQDFAARSGEQQWLLIKLATASSHATKPK